MEHVFKKATGLGVIKHLYNKRLLIVFVTALFAISSIIISLILPNEYKSTANLLPAKKTNFGLNLFADGGLGGLTSSLFGQNSDEISNYYILLNSRTVKEKVIEEFNLIEVYDTKNAKFPKLAAIEQLEENTSFEALEEGNFTINVWDRDPKRAQMMAKYYVNVLSDFNNTIAIQEAKNFREFIESQYQRSEETLATLRDELASFQAKNQVFELPTQLSEYVTLSSQLSLEKLMAETELSVAEKKMNDNSQIYRELENKIEAFDSIIEQVLNDTSSTNLIPNYNNIPALTLQYFELQARIEVQVEVLKFMLPIYEQAKMEEAKSLPIVSVIDEPIIPEKKDKPRRSIIVILSTISGGLLIIFFLLIELNYKNNKALISYALEK